LHITVNIVLDILSELPVKNFINKDRNFSFERIEFISDSSEMLESKVLYFAGRTQISKLCNKSSPDVCIVCPANESEFESSVLSSDLNLLLLPEDSDIFGIANRLLNGFRQLAEWENELKEAVYAGKSLQTFSEIGGKIFGQNPLVFCSSSYNLVGRSMTETPYNEKVSEVLKRGYFTKEEADTVSRMGYQAHRNDYREGVLINPPTYMGCPFFLFSFPGGLKQISFITVYFIAGEPTEGLMDVFRAFAHLLQEYCESIENDGSRLPSPLEMFMDDLLMHTHDDELYLIDRAKQLQLPLDETYCLGLIQWEEYSRDQAEYVLWRVRYGLNFPVFRVMRYHDSVLMVFKGTFPKALIMQKLNEALTESSDFLSMCGGHIGFSTEVNSLLKLDVAYKQSCAALKQGRKLAADKKLYFYSDYYIYDMVEAYGEKFRPDDMFIQRLRLLNDSEEGRYSNFHLLRYYLLSERSLSVTARMLHMHRNSVIYRLGKIEKILDLDLDDPDVRLRLLVSFKIIEYLNGQELPKIEKNDSDE